MLVVLTIFLSGLLVLRIATTLCCVGCPKILQFLPNISYWPNPHLLELNVRQAQIHPLPVRRPHLYHIRQYSHLQLQHFWPICPNLVIFCQHHLVVGVGVEEALHGDPPDLDPDNSRNQDTVENIDSKLRIETNFDSTANIDCCSLGQPRQSLDWQRRLPGPRLQRRLGCRQSPWRLWQRPLKVQSKMQCLYLYFWPRQCLPLWAWLRAR